MYRKTDISSGTVQTRNLVEQNFSLKDKNKTKIQYNQVSFQNKKNMNYFSCMEAKTLQQQQTCIVRNIKRSPSGKKNVDEILNLH